MGREYTDFWDVNFLDFDVEVWAFVYDDTGFAFFGNVVGCGAIGVSHLDIDLEVSCIKLIQDLKKEL